MEGDDERAVLTGGECNDERGEHLSTWRGTVNPISFTQCAQHERKSFVFVDSTSQRARARVTDALQNRWFAKVDACSLALSYATFIFFRARERGLEETHAPHCDTLWR